MGYMLHSFPRSSSGCSVIQQWEAAGTALLAALTNYSNSCLLLGNNAKQYDPHAINLAAQIDLALETHSAISLQLKRSSASLGHTRNRLSPPLNRVPEEILSRILLSYIYNPLIDDKPASYYGTPLYLEQGLREIHHRRCNLLSVCTFWRNIVLTQGAFWSTIPVTKKSVSSEDFEASLQRAPGKSLHLAVAIKDTIPNHIFDTLSTRISRVDCLSICSSSLPVTRRVLTMFLQKSAAPRLSRLLLCRGRTLVLEEPVEESKYIFTQNTGPGLRSIGELIKPLSILWIDNAYLHWDPIGASNLVELRLQNLIFATAREFLAFVRSISLAPQLRELRMVSVNCISSDEGLIVDGIRFPNLQYLTLKRLYLNTLQTFFAFVDPGSYRLALGLSYESRRYRISSPNEDPEQKRDIGELLLALSGVPVNSLLLDQRLQEGFSRHPGGVSGLLRRLPELQTLTLSCWKLRKGDLEELVHPDGPPSENHDEDKWDFPRLRSLRLISGTILEEGGLKKVVKSHPLQLLELCARGYSTLDPTPGRPRAWYHTGLRPLSSEILDWLRSEVAEVRLVDEYYCPPDFSSQGQNLW